MKIVAISDTHQLHHQVNLPEGDVLVHCGDFTNKGSEKAIEDFLEWFSNQPHPYKVFIGGNHELGLDMGAFRNKKLKLVKSFTNDNLFYLENSAVVIEGIKFYGSPYTPFFFNWAWNLRRGAPLAANWSLIPEDTQVLMTHGPPYGILDQTASGSQGCQDLFNRIENLGQLKLHLFGHLHLEGGNQTVRDGKIFANAAVCDDSYRPIHSPIVVEI